jgi:hypothetical protein
MYIPKGKLDPNIYYTNGGEYYLSTTRTEYKGYYHKDLLGGVWADKEHSENSIKLVSLTLNDSPIAPYINSDDSTSLTYYNISQISNKPTPQQVSQPSNNSLPPTENDYQQTYYTRYILSYRLSSSPLAFVEVNKQTYYTISNSLEAKYYNMVEVLWKIYGPLYDKKENSILIEGGVVDSNLRSVQEASKVIPYISNYLNNLTLYAQIVG